jgi:hypothetical protein
VVSAKAVDEAVLNKVHKNNQTFLFYKKEEKMKKFNLEMIFFSIDLIFLLLNRDKFCMKLTAKAL